MRRTWPAANGILKPSGAVFGRPCTQYVQKLWILALLAVGDDRRAGRLEARDRVANRRVVERVERRVLAVGLATASISARGLGMLPMGSVGMVICLF